MAEGVSEEEFYAESAAWAAARGADPAARELLDLGAHGDPGDDGERRGSRPAGTA